MKMAKYIFTVIRSRTAPRFDEWLDSLEYDELVSEDDEDEE